MLAVALSIKGLREPDLWWQIHTGEWILENGKVPTQDVFSYTYNGAPWVNIKWGFEVVAALITKAFGPEFIFLLQALVSGMLLLLLLKCARIYLPDKAGTKVSDSFLLSIAALLTLFACEYRFNGRPEMFSHLFAVLFLFILLRYRTEDSNKILWLVPLQLLWANMHEAFGMGVILIGLFTVSAWVEYLLTAKKKLTLRSKMPIKLSLLLLLAAAIIVVNPNGLVLLTKPFNILGQVYENKFSTELLDYSRAEYWQWNTYLAIAMVLIGIAGAFLHFKQLKIKGSKFSVFVAHFGIGYLLLLPAFLYLALTAYRNIIFLVLVSFPLFVFGLQNLLQRIKALQTKAFATASVLSGVILIAYGLVISNKYYEWTGSHDKFGLQVFATYNPVGAADYIEAHSIKGPFFSDYLTSSYLLYRLQPDFKSFIDLRDLDVFPAEFFNKYAMAITYSDEFARLDSAYRFNCVVLYRPQFAAIHRYLISESRFKLAYADAVACVFIPRRDSADNAPLTFSATGQVTHHVLSNAINHLLNPLFKWDDSGNNDKDYIAAAYFTTVGRLTEAEDYAKRSASGNIDSYKGLEVLGEIFYNKALQATTKEEKDKLLEMALNYYKQSLAANADFAASYLGVGAVYFQQQNISVALENFDRCLAIDAENLNANIFAAECCKYFVNLNNAQSAAYTDRAIGYYHNADRLNPHNPTIELNLGFLYFRKNDCGRSTNYLKNLEGYTGLSPQEQQQVKGCLQKCAK